MYLSLVFHNHQPVGNLNFVFEEAFAKAYQPLTNCLDRHPTIKVAMHFTGPLLQWLQDHEPEYLLQVAAQVQRGQLEILSGAYYEPILAMVQDADKIGQIRKLSESVKTLFGAEPRGMWLAERIWEPHLSKPINEAGIDYTIIDDAHFIWAGIPSEKLFGYFITEEQGHTLKLVPTHTKLRYLVPWRPVHEVMDWLREQNEHHNQPGQPPLWAVIGEDGEKFGLWPHTYPSVWEEGWLDTFFSQLENSQDWLETIHPAEYVQRYRAQGIAYVPTATYMEMSEWALPAPDSWLLRDLRETYELQLENIPEWDNDKRGEIERILRFIRGGFWRNFLVKYPEINHMQKRGLALSKKIHALPPSHDHDLALDALWASQCNAGYWHGVFGGVYLFHIRSINFSNIIKAETLIDQRDGVWVEEVDFNADSYDEVLAGNGPLMLVIEPKQGGMITEFDHRPGAYNLLNVMSRYPEGYHTQIQEAAATNMLMTPGDDPKKFEGEPVRAKERGLENYIYVDWHRRGMLVDHFLGDETTLHGFETAKYPEQGDYVNQDYQVEIDQSDSDSLKITLTRDGHVWKGREHLPIQIEKTITLTTNTSSVRVQYRITNNSTQTLGGRFGVELAMGFDGGDNREYCYLVANNQTYGMGDSGEIHDVAWYRVVSKIRSLGVRINMSQPATLWRFPLAPITLSEGGFERVHQGFVAMPWWKLNLAPQSSWEFELDLLVEPHV